MRIKIMRRISTALATGMILIGGTSVYATCRLCGWHVEKLPPDKCTMEPIPEVDDSVCVMPIKANGQHGKPMWVKKSVYNARRLVKKPSPRKAQYKGPIGPIGNSTLPRGPHSVAGINQGGCTPQSPIPKNLKKGKNKPNCAANIKSATKRTGRNPQTGATIQPASKPSKPE